LNKNFRENEQAGNLFIDQYQDLVYGNEAGTKSEEYLSNYKKILALIFKSWKDKMVAKMRSRLSKA